MKFIHTALLVLFILALTACNLTLAEDLTPPPGYASPTPEPTLGPSYPLAPPDPLRGATIYTEKCAPCHGATGMGDGPQGLQLPVPVPALGLPEVARLAVPSDWYAVVTRGRMEKMMPPFASLTDQQRWDVIAYTLTLSLPPDQVEAGRLLFEANCSACPPSLFQDQARMTFLSQRALMQWLQDGGDGLPALGNDLTESELWSMAAYLRTLSFAPPLSAQTTAPATPPGLLAETLVESAPEAATNLTPTGTVSGTVVNGSGTALPSGLKIVLHGFDQDASGRVTEEVTLEAFLKEDGTFAFDNVPMPLNRVFIAVVEYGGVEHTSALAYAQEAQSGLTLPITLYETTTDTSALSVDRWHIFLNFETPGLVQVIELLVISNPENRVVTSAAPEEPVLSFNLPEGASNLQFENGQLGDGRYIRTANGFGDRAPIRPGMGAFQTVFAYDLPYARSLELSRFTSLPVVSAMVMAPEGIKVQGDLLQRGETRQFQDTNVTIYNTQPLPAGAMLTFTVSGKPRTGTMVNPADQQTLLLTLTVLGLVLIFAGLYLFWRERSRPAPEAQPEPLDTDSLMDAIIALDDLYKAEKLGEESYQTRRAELKSLLKERLQNK